MVTAARSWSPRRFLVAPAALSLILGPTAWSLLLGFPAHATADEPAEPIRLSYQATEGCPDQATFVRRVLARTHRVRPAWPDEPARTFVVMATAGPPATGQVTIRAQVGPEKSRSLQGETCSDVVDGMALVVALAIDPRWGDGPLPTGLPPVLGPSGDSARAATSQGSLAEIDKPPASPEGIAPCPPLPPGSPALENALINPPVAPAAPLAVAPPESTADRAASPLSQVASGDHASVGVSATRSFFVGGDFVVATGVAPDALLAGSPYVGWRANRAGWVDPSVRLAFLRATSGTLDVVGEGSANFTWTVGRLDVCPLASPRWAARARACVRAEAGALEGRGFGISGAADRLRAWLAAGPILRLEWALPWPLFIDGEVGVLLRAIDDRFVFQPQVLIDRVPLVGATAGIGLGIDFL